MSIEVKTRIPKGVDAEKVKHRIEEVLGIIVSDRFDKFLEYLEVYGLLRLEEESLKDFLGDEPDVYNERDIKR